jgi:hypothetical protein
MSWEEPGNLWKVLASLEALGETWGKLDELGWDWRTSGETWQVWRPPGKLGGSWMSWEEPGNFGTTERTGMTGKGNEGKGRT